MSHDLIIQTRRMELVFASAEMVRADRDDRAQLATLLNARITERWPTEYWDQSAMDWTIAALESGDNAEGWGMWYWILKPHAAHQRTLAGHGGFKSKPNSAGIVEVGYAIVYEHRRCGLATEASRALCSWAFSHPHVELVAAETLPELHESIGVMTKLGMRAIGEASEPGAIRYGVRRDAFASAPGSQNQSGPPAERR